MPNARRYDVQPGWPAVSLNAAANAANAAGISAPDSRTDVRVIPTDEEWILALYAAELIA